MSYWGSKLAWLKSKAIYEWYPLKARRKLSFYKDMIGKGDLCLDVGAHLGDRSSTFLDLGAQVVAIEPQPKFAAYLSKKFSGIAEINIESIALSDKVGESVFHISNHHPTLSTLSGKDWHEQMNNATAATINFDEKITITTSTLDALSSKYGRANFIKIDVEGYEWQVLQGLSYQPDFLSIEFLSFEMGSLEQSLTYLASLGYREFNWSFKESFVMYNQKWTDDASVLQSIKNYTTGVYSGDVYVRKSKNK